MARSRARRNFVTPFWFDVIKKCDVMCCPQHSFLKISFSIDFKLRVQPAWKWMHCANFAHSIALQSADADILTPIVCRCIQHYHTRGTRSTQDGWKTSVKRWWLASPLWTHQCQSLQSTLLPVVIATPHVLPHLLLDHPETRTRRSMLVSYQMLIYYLVGTATSSILKIVISLNLGRLTAKSSFS